MEATLAASDAAMCLEECQEEQRPTSDWRRRFREIVGGGHAQDDLVAQYINLRAQWVAIHGCDCEKCQVHLQVGQAQRGPPYMHLDRQRAIENGTM